MTTNISNFDNFWKSDILLEFADTVKENFNGLFQELGTSIHLKQTNSIMNLATTPGGTHILRHTWMYRTNGLAFHHKSSDKGHIFVKKSLEEGPISPKLQQKLKMCSDLQKFLKNCQISHFFKGEKSLMGGVSDLGPHTSRNHLSRAYPHPHPPHPPSWDTHLEQTDNFSHEFCNYLTWIMSWKKIEFRKCHKIGTPTCSCIKNSKNICFFVFAPPPLQGMCIWLME